MTCLHIFTLKVPENRIKARSHIDFRQTATHTGCQANALRAARNSKNRRHLLSSHREDGGAHRLAQEQDAEEMDLILHGTTFVTLDEEHTGVHMQKGSEPLYFIWILSVRWAKQVLSIMLFNG